MKLSLMLGEDKNLTRLLVGRMKLEISNLTVNPLVSQPTPLTDTRHSGEFPKDVGDHRIPAFSIRGPDQPFR